MDGADGVYPSSEDTFLLIDALQRERAYLAELLPAHPVCVEVGSGGGEVSKAIPELFPPSHSPVFSLSTDVNPLAASRTRATVSKAHSDVVLMDLFTAIHAKVDMVVFNPPYVPTDDDELRRALETRDISASWAGGPGAGRHVIDRFVRELPSVLNFEAHPVVYIVLLEQNDPDAVARLAAAECGLTTSHVVMKRRAGIETLYVMRLTTHAVGMYTSCELKQER